MVRSDAISSIGRAAHDVGLGALIGGNLFARFGMHPAVASISEPRERGEVVNEAWRRYGLVNSLATTALLGGWIGARVGETRPRMLSRAERRTALAKDAALALTTVSGLAAGIQGVRFSRMEPHGAVPLRDGDHAAPEADAAERRAKRRLNLIGSAHLASAIALAGANAALSQQSFRRPPVRRVLRRRY